jgi:TolB-like protein
MSFVQELKRRNVFRVGIAYVVVSWLVTQVLEVVLDSFGAPEWVMKTVLVILAAGLPFALIFAWAFELTPEGLKKEKDVDRSQSITQQTGRKLDFAIIFVLVAALGYFAWDKFVLTPERHAELVKSVQEGAEADAADAGLKSIAVLPFVNMSEDAGNEYFSDGISEEILNALARVRELKVAGRTSSFAFKGQNQDLRQIGDALGVDHILEGSVRKAGNTVRITAQLIEVGSGFHLWSETYDRELVDVFAIQDEISAAILNELKATLLEDESPAVRTARTDSEAYDLYLLAKQRMYERTGPNIESAAELLDRAIAIDPEYAPAYAQRGIATLLLSEGSGSYGDIPRAQSQSQGQLYLDKALELDPNLAEAWAGLGLLYSNEPTAKSWEKSVEVLQKALSINPGLIDAMNWLHNSYQALGRPDDAGRVMIDLVERDPLYRPGVRNIINYYIHTSQQEKGLAHLQRIEPLIPNDAVIQSAEAALMWSLGETARAVELSESAVELQATNSVARDTRSFTWIALHRYDRVAEEGENWMRVRALFALGRLEEAGILAYQLADENADVETLFGFLNISGRSGELIAYLEQRWPDLEALRDDFPVYSGRGDFLMLDVALAYSRAGDQERFDQAMAMVEEAHRSLEAQGMDNLLLSMNEASRLSMAGDLDASLDWLDRAISGGFVTSTPIADFWPFLEPLEGDPRFEAIQARMVEHLNAERDKLGLEPVST